MILLVFICVFIGVILKILGVLKGPILFVLGIFIIYLIIRAIKEAKQNKGKRKSIFHNRTELELIDLLKPQLEGLKKPNFYKIYENNKILLVNNNGVYLIFVVNYKGVVEGKEKDDYLIIKNTKYRKKVPNILLEIDKLKEKIKPDEVYLIINNNCNFNVKTKIKVLKSQYFYYEFMKLEKKYDTTELKEKFDNFCKLLSKEK